MADMLNTRPLDHSATEIDYKPISGWAVAALVISGLFILVVGAIAATALYNKRPALSWFWIILAAIGLVLSIVARVHIKRSEGTRAGLKQATIAWWFSVLGGAAFLAYFMASQVALKQQAERAAFAWFKLLKECKKDPSKINDAFLWTQDPAKREGVEPTDLTKLDALFGGGPLPGFRNSDLVRYFERNGEDVEVVSLGISSWEQIDAGYRMECAFRLRTPEGVANLNVILFGSEGKNIAGREWHILMPPGGMTFESSTTYGRLLNHLQDEAQQVATTWMRSFSNKESADYYLMTLPASKRRLMLAALDAARIAYQKTLAFALQTNAELPAPPLSFTAIPDVTLSPDELKSPDLVFNALQANGFFGVGAVTEDKKSRLRHAFRIGMMLKGGDSRMVNPDTAGQIYVTPQEIRYTFPVDIALPTRPPAVYGGRLVIVSQTPELVAELNDQYAKGKANPAAADESPFNLLSQRPPRDWRVLRLETNLELLAPPKQAPGGPGGGPPGGPPGGPSMPGGH